MQDYPCAVVLGKGNKIDIFPFIVNALNENEAMGKAHAIGIKVCPVGSIMFVRVGPVGETKLENAFLVKDGG